MKINKSETKVQMVNRREHKALDIRVGGEKIKEVQEYKYLGSLITRDGRNQKEIRSRIEQAKRVFFQKGQVFRAKIDLGVRLRFLRAYVWSVALYGCATWTIGTLDRKRIEAFKLWCYRKMLRIKWTEKVRNEEVLRRIRGDRVIWKMLVKRRTRMIGHNLRHPVRLATVLEGMVEGKNWKGKPRQSYEDQILKIQGASPLYI
ncbi:hypothetical protein PGB90_007243 [Kerria lacca]